MSTPETRPAPPSARAWVTVLLLAIGAALNYLDRTMVSTMRGSIESAIPMTDTQFGLLTSVFLWVYAFLSPFAGFLADRAGRTRVIIGSVLVWSSITWATGHSHTFGQLLATRALMGISEACYIPAALALISDYHVGRTRSLATGIFMCGILIGTGFGGVSGRLAEFHTWNYSFGLFGALGVSYSVLLMLDLRDTPALLAERTPARRELSLVSFAQSVKQLFALRSFILLFFFWGILGISGWAAIGWLPTFLGERFNLGQGTSGMYATAYLQPASFIGMLLGGALADYWSGSSDRGRILVPLFGLCVAGPCVFFAVNAPLLGLSFAALFVYKIAVSFCDSNLMPILCSVVAPRLRATGYGILNLFSCAVGGFTIYLGGALRDAQVPVRHVFEGAAVGMGVCAVLLWFVRATVPAGPIPK